MENNLAKLCKLRNAWQQIFQRKATGGIHALSGFNYQFGVFLLKFLKRWATARKNHDPIPSPDSFTIEAISDLAELSSEGIIYVTQVKLSPDPDYPKIFDDFWNIFDLAKQVIPGDESKLRFVICKSTGSLPDIRKNFRLWTKKQRKPELREAELEPLLDIMVVSLPHDQIFGILVNDLNDDKPAEHLFEWIGRLLSASNEGDFKYAVKAIYDDLVKIAKRPDVRENLIYVWQATDRPPSHINKGKFLTGEQPLPLHLRLGFFAPRPKIYNDLTETFTQWWQAQSQETNCLLRLPVFWIGGRSGSGKSVALLHLLANIHAMGDIHILWIGHYISHFHEAIQWATVLREQGHEAIIAADDPFAPATQNDAEIWRNAFASLESLRCKGKIERMPILLCCGPTEHGNNFAQSYPDNVVVRIETLPIEEQSDYDELRAWYKKRTGSDAPEVGDYNVLLVQLFFEWRTKGTLREFARRFQDRIKETDSTGNLYDRFSRVLAANRLYIGYPMIAFEEGLSTSQLVAVDLLRSENHLADMSSGRKGVWLAHPHLSNAIYESWYPADKSSRIREKHLADIINNSLQYGVTPPDKTAPLWAISRSLSDEEEAETIVGRLDHKTIASLLPNIYKQRLDASGKHTSIFELPVWIQLRATFPDIGFAPDPFDFSLSRLQPENITVGFRLMCHKLLEHSDHMTKVQTAKLTESLSRLLTATVHSWHEWPHIAAEFYKRTGDNTAEILLTEWLQLNSRKTLAQRALIDLLHSDRKSAAIDEAAAAALHSASDDSEIWSDIAKQIIRRRYSDSAVHSVCEWAAQHCEELRTRFLLAEMVRVGFPEAVNWALAWAQLWHKEPSANWVLEALCEQPGCEPRTRDLCITWLNLDYTQANPGFLAEKLLKAFPEDPIVCENILQWLQRTPPSISTWLFVWNAAYTNMPDKRHLIKMGIDGLASVRPVHSLWLTSWQILWNAGGNNAHLMDIGLYWLKRLQRNKPEWLDVWHVLWSASNRRNDFFEIGLQWLSVCMSNKGWGAFWREFWVLHHGDRRLISLANKWLTHNIWQWNVWFAIWQEIWKTNKEDENALDLAQRWLSIAPSSLPSWLIVWEIVWSYTGAYDDLRVLGMNWLRSTERDHGAWQRIWAYFWKDKKGDKELSNMGNEWLISIPLTNGSWPKMWKDLFPLNKHNADLIRVGLEWVSNENNFEHGDWQHNWKELVGVQRPNDNLLSLGEKWLRITPAYNNYWVDVWMHLSKHTGMTPLLLDLAKGWLQQTSPERNKWSNLWLRIREAKADTASLRQKVITFIEKNPRAAEWFPLWVSLRATKEDNRKIDEVGLRWLNYMLLQRPGTQNWHQAWATLWETVSFREKLAALAIQWLRRVSPDDTAWHKIWGAVRDAQPESVDIIKIGRDWILKAKLHHQGWYHVWQSLFEKHMDDKELLQKAMTWLENAPPQHLSWGDVWLKIYQHGEDKKNLEPLAMTWLIHTASLQKSLAWPAIWRLLWERDKFRDRLLTTGIEWLKVSQHGKETWYQVFDTLWQSGQSREVLQALKEKNK